MITFELITLDGVKFTEECYEVLLPTPQGQIAIFPEHAPLISVASPGVISVRKRQGDKDDQLLHFASDGGLIEIDDKRVRLLADVAEEANDIDEAKSKEALKRAKELQRQATSQVALADATALIERHAAQIKVAELKRRTRKNR